MQPGKRSALLTSADKPLRPTWAEIGRVSKKGQTEKGQVAEKMIATATVDLVKRLVGLSEDEFVVLYND